MRVRVTVADMCEASFYDLQHRQDVPRLAARLSDPLGRLHDRDFRSDRPGRSFDHAPLSSGRRGSTPHHSVGGERRARTHEAELFAMKIANELERGWRSHEFDRLVIMAPPAFLGLLRKALPESVRGRIAAEVVKDLVHQSPEVLQSHLPWKVFREALHT